MIEFTLGVVNVERIPVALGELGSEIGSIASVADDLAKVFYNIEANLFSSEGVTGSRGKWAVLSEPYGKWKKKHYPDAGILVREGNLVGSLTSGTHPHSIREERGSDSLFLGSEVPYGVYHRDAGGPPGLPQRLPIDLSDADVNEFSKAWQRWCNRSIAQIFRGLD